MVLDVIWRIWFHWNFGEKPEQNYKDPKQIFFGWLNVRKQIIMKYLMQTWKWMHATEKFCKKQNGLKNLFTVLQQYDISFPKDAFRVYFTSNHDENSWNGTEYEKYGKAAKAFAVFSCTWYGISMIYSGQELPNYKRLHFFDKDQIEWKQQCGLHDFYRTLLHMRKTNAALRAADTNVVTYKIETNNDDKIFAFVRKNGGDEVLVILNLSAEVIILSLIHI